MMAANVFGSPINNETLKGMVQYKGETVTCKDGAYVALLMKNTGGKDKAALDFVEGLKSNYDKDHDEREISTRCLIYNATGNTLRCVTEYNWEGQLEQFPYPMIIQNGQWAAFLHSGTSSQSKSAVVYAGKTYRGYQVCWLLSWCCTNYTTNKVYTEIHNPEYCYTSTIWEAVKNRLDNSRLVYHEEKLGCAAYASIGNHFQSICEGVMTLDTATNA